MNLRISAALAATVALASCGGGGNDPARLVSQLDYTPVAYTHRSYAPYVTGSRLRIGAGGDGYEISIGGDLEPRSKLRHITTDNGIRYYLGASRDGVGVERLKKYEFDLITSNGTVPASLWGDGFKPFTVQPYLSLDPDLMAPENVEILMALSDSVFILNDILPPEFQISAAGDTSSYHGQIRVNLESPASIRSICGAGSVACAQNTPLLADSTFSSVLYLPDDFDVSETTYTRSTIIHELLHALGIQGHVDSVEFPDSIMGGAGGYIPNLGHIISKIDREVLQIMYMRQRTGTYNDWGEWSDTTFHLTGRTDDEALNFGVALFNGLPQPWVRGVLPDTVLADNNACSARPHGLDCCLDSPGRLRYMATPS